MPHLSSVTACFLDLPVLLMCTHVLVLAGGSRGTVAPGCAGPAGEAASAATARSAAIGVDGVGFGAGDTWLDKPTGGASAAS